MRTRTRRWLAVGIGAALLVLGAGWTGYLIGRGEIEPALPRGHAPDHSPGAQLPRERAPSDPVGSRAGLETHPIGTDPTVGPGEDGRGPGPEPDEEFPVIDVEVCDATGLPEVSADVYVLGEGASGVDEIELVPHGETDAQGRCQVRLPSSGRYDIGAVRGFGQVLLPSVAVPASGPVRLFLPPVAEVSFSAGAELDAGDIVVVVVATVPDPRQANFPGRNQRLRAEHATIKHRGAMLPVPAAGGLELEAVVRHSGTLLVEPARFSAPATVAVVRGESVFAHLAFSPPDRTWPVPVNIDVHLDWGEGARTPTAGTEYSFRLPAHTPLAVLPERYVTPNAVVRTRRGTLRWSGPAIHPGEAAWDLDMDPDLLVTIKVDDASSDLTRRPTVCVVDPERLARGEPSVWQLESVPGREAEVDWDSSPGPVGVPTELRREVRWVIATEGDSAVAGPRAISPDSSEERLALRRGGWLIVVPERISGGGKPRLRRADGAPLLLIDHEGDTGMSSAAALHAGLRLGPFEPGELDLVLDDLDGRSRVFRLTIRPGRFTPLTVASCPAW